MSSVRAQRRAGSEVLKGAASTFRQKSKETAEIVAALDLAAEALAEEPRAVHPCSFTVEYAPLRHVALERAHCSECGGAFDGWTAEGPHPYRFCPHCGSNIARVQRENDPHARHDQEIAARAAKNLKSAFEGEPPSVKH